MAYVLAGWIPSAHRRGLDFHKNLGWVVVKGSRSGGQYQGDSYSGRKFNTAAPARSAVIPPHGPWGRVADRAGGTFLTTLRLIMQPSLDQLRGFTVYFAHSLVTVSIIKTEQPDSQGSDPSMEAHVSLRIKPNVYIYCRKSLEAVRRKAPHHFITQLYTRTNIHPVSQHVLNLSQSALR